MAGALTREISYSIGDGKRSAHPLSTTRHVFSEKQLSEPLLHHFHFCKKKKQSLFTFHTRALFHSQLQHKAIREEGRGRVPVRSRSRL